MEPHLETLAKLRQPVHPQLVSKKPIDVQRGAAKSTCRVCHGWHAPSGHLDFVGHAAVTNILLDADPLWRWEPLATDEHGAPIIDRYPNGAPAGMWITLTVGGMSRIGYGSVESGKAAENAMKEIIGDALRNAAMRFGLALDLWSKADLHSEGSAAIRDTPPGEAVTAPAMTSTALRADIKRLCPDQSPAEIAEDFLAWSEGTSITDAPVDMLVRFRDALKAAS